jgi:hemolysin activation/secretion protein
VISEVEKTQEVLEKEEILRERLQEERKLFINKIVVEGISLLSSERIKEIILPFQKHWLSKKEIQQIVDLIIQAYRQEGYRELPARVSYSIEKKCLNIHVEEFQHGFNFEK